MIYVLTFSLLVFCSRNISLLLLYSSYLVFSWSPLVLLLIPLALPGRFLCIHVYIIAQYRSFCIL
jgi:hypothetical protein